MNDYRALLHSRNQELPLIEINVLALLTDPQGNVMLTREKDSIYWVLPGGWMEPRQSLTDCLQHNLMGNFGILPEDNALVKVFSDPAQSYLNSDSVKICPVYMVVYPRQIRGTLRFKPKNGAEIRFFAPWNVPMNRVFPPMKAVLTFYQESFTDESGIRRPDWESFPDILE